MMRFRIAIWDPLPVYRQGIMTVLNDLGHILEEPADLLSWASKREQRIALMSITSDLDWSLLVQASRVGDRVILIALLDDLSIESCVRALSSGASSLAARAARPEEIRLVVTQALIGRSPLPNDVVAALVARLGSPEESPLSEQDRQWLRALSNGVTVARMAGDMGYSERAMYRLLRNLYGRMSVRNRTEAVLKASQSGWI
jgi:DNA-binding NarL/FixJ family response regulator